MSLEKMRELNPHLPTSTVLVFLYVVNKPDLTMREVEKLIGLTSSAASRHVLLLTERGDVARNQPGLGLIEQYTDDQDMRVKRLRLTPRGAALADALEKINEIR